MSFGGSSPSGTQVIQQNNAPWSGQQPYLSTGFERASQLLDQPLQYFPNSTVVPFSDETNQALAALTQRAQGSPLESAAQGNIQQTLGGDFLNNNPYLDATYNQAAGKVRSSLDSQFNAAGRLGTGGVNGAHEAAMGDALANLGTQIYGQNYQQERGRQMQAAQLAPGLAGLDFNNIAALSQVGQTREQQAGSQLQDQINRFNFEQQEPNQRLRDYMATVAGGSFGSQGTTTSPIYSNPAGNILGLGLGAAGLGNMLFGQSGSGLLRGLLP